MQYVKQFAVICVVSGLTFALLAISAGGSYATPGTPPPPTPIPTQSHSVGVGDTAGDNSAPLGDTAVVIEAGETIPASAPSTLAPQQTGAATTAPPNPCNPASRRPDPRNIDKKVISLTFPAEESVPFMSSKEIQDECIHFTERKCTWERISTETIDPVNDVYRTDARGVDMVNSRHKADIAWGSLQGKENKAYYKIYYGISAPCVTDPNEPLRQSLLILSSDPGSAGVAQQEIARRAVAQMSLTPPQPWISLGTQNNTPYTLVRAHTWFATNPATFKPLTKTVRAGTSWVEVSATPTGLRFTPGQDNQPPVECTGPGVIDNGQFDTTTRPWWNQPPNSTCSYQYPHSSPGDPNQPLTATLQTRWQIRWTGSGNTTGQLPDMYSSATTSYAVTEAQTLVTK